MTDTSIVSRRLEPEGCITAGSKAAVEAKALQEGGITLHAEVDTRLAAVGSWTARVQEQMGVRRKMFAVDRGADRAVAAFDDALESKEGAFADPDVLDLTTEEQSRVAVAIAVRSHVLANGTSFLRLPYYKQWVRLVALKQAVGEKQSDIQALGLTLEAARVVRWVDLYGATLGVTDAANVDVDQLAVAQDGWHKAWEEFAIAVLYHYKGDTGDNAKVRSKLLSPYEQVAEKERAEVRKRRAKRKAALSDDKGDE